MAHAMWREVRIAMMAKASGGKEIAGAGAAAETIFVAAPGPGYLGHSTLQTRIAAASTAFWVPAKHDGDVAKQ